MKKGYVLDAAVVVSSILLTAVVLLSVASDVSKIEFNQKSLGVQTRYLSFLNRYISSADCLAYENIFVDKDIGTDTYVTYSEIQPAVIDLRKVLDVRHRECITQDALYSSGGESLHYDVYIKDYTTGQEFYYWNPSYINKYVSDVFTTGFCDVLVEDEGSSDRCPTYNFLCNSNKDIADLWVSLALLGIIAVTIVGVLTAGIGTAAGLAVVIILGAFGIYMATTPYTYLTGVTISTFNQQLIGGTIFEPIYYDIIWISNFTQENFVNKQFSSFDLSKDELRIFPLDCYYSQSKHAFNIPIRIVSFDEDGNKEFHLGRMYIRFCALEKGGLS